MSQPSRFDTRELISGVAGHFFNAECLYPLGFNRYQCDIRTRFCKEPLLPNTKVVLLLGDMAMKDYLITKMPDLKDNHLGELRGSPYVIDGIVYIASYSPQDCVDPQDYETRLNPFLKIAALNGTLRKEIEGDAQPDADPTADKRRHGITSRDNYRFWLKQDIKKCVNIIKNDGKIPEAYASPNYIIYPSAATIIDTLSNVQEEFLDFDMETYSDLFAITCFSYSIGDSPDVFIVPIYRHDYTLAYDKITICKILRALAQAILRNTLVAHNGSGFDYMVLSYRYHIPINRVWDSMIAAHRCYPEIEKSLGHQTSLWTYEPFHKDEINFAFGSSEQAHKLWAYCGKDVWTMKLIRKAILEYAKKRPGLNESLEQAMASIKPYLITSLFGIKYNEVKVAEIMSENDRLMNQYLRIIRLLSGRELNPGSPPQCVDYFHKQLGYPVVGYGKKKKDGTKGPSLNEKNMLKLRLKVNNPAIDFCLAYRQVAKESGSLKFIPWKE